MPVIVIPVVTPAPITQGTVASTVGQKFNLSPLTVAPFNRPITIRQISFSSVDITEEYLSIIVDGVERACVLIK